MKVLGKIEDNKYICEVSHVELAKFMDQYYNKAKDELGKLKPGDEVYLGKGYDFLIDIKNALNKTTAFIEANKKIIETIISGISFLGDSSTEKEDN